MDTKNGGGGENSMLCARNKEIGSEKFDKEITGGQKVFTLEEPRKKKIVFTQISSLNLPGPLTICNSGWSETM